jgi:hypothetical protein
MQSADPDLSLLLDGPMGDFGTFRDMVHGNHRGRPMRIRLAVDELVPSERDDAVHVSADIDIEFKYRVQRRELVVREMVLRLDQRHLVTAALSSDSQRHVITRLGPSPVSPAQRSSISAFLRIHHFLPQLWTYRRRPGNVAPKILSKVEGLEEDAFRAVDALAHALIGVEYLSAMRQAPERTYHQTGAARTRIGQTGDNWAGLFVLDSAKAPKARDILPELTAWLKKANLAADVRLNWLSDRHYEVQVQHPQTREYQNLADVGQANRPSYSRPRGRPAPWPRLHIPRRGTRDPSAPACAGRSR